MTWKDYQGSPAWPAPNPSFPLILSLSLPLLPSLSLTLLPLLLLLPLLPNKKEK